MKNIEGRIAISVDLEFKNSHTFENGTKIRLERQYNNFNRRETEPINGIVISADNIPTGAEVLIHQNSTSPVNEIYDHKPLSGIVASSNIRYFSIPEEECYAWRMGTEEWKPCKNFEFALRVFEPYRGMLEGVEHTKIKNVLYITNGTLKGYAVRCLKASDYEMIFQNEHGREQRIIRCRHFPDEINEREEIVAIDFRMTEKINNGELYVGLSTSDAKPLFQPILN